MCLIYNKFTLALTIAFISNSTTFAQSQIPNSFPLQNPFQPAYIASVENNLNSSINTSTPSDNIINDTYNYKLNYVLATETKEALQNICHIGKITAEPLSNTIIFYGPDSEAKHIKKILKDIDMPSYQITLEAKVLSLNNEDSQNLGISWHWDKVPQVSKENKTTNSNSTIEDNHGNLKIWHDFSFRFGATLNALQSKGKAKLLASPRIITLPGKKASIFIGDHIPVQTEQHNSSGNYTSTEYLDAGIKLEYTPIVNTDGTMVTAAVHTEVSTPSLISEIKNYKITSRTVDTNVRMKNGETLVIGGLINDEEQNTLQQIPFLSKLPILGNLFKNRNHAKAKTEVVLILTPYITKAGQSPAIYQNSFNSLNNTPLN